MYCEGGEAPEQVVDAPFLAVFKDVLDGALGKQMPLTMAGGWNEMTLKAPSDPNHFMSL